MIDKGFFAGNRLYVSIAHSDKLIKKYLTNIQMVFLKKFKKLYMKKNLKKKYIKFVKLVIKNTIKLFFLNLKKIQFMNEQIKKNFLNLKQR